MAGKQGKDDNGYTLKSHVTLQADTILGACPDFCVTAIFRLIRLTGLQTQS